MADLTTRNLPPPPPSWVLDLSAPQSQSKSSQKLPDPPGFSKPSSSSNKKSKSQSATTTTNTPTNPEPRLPPTQEETDLLRLKQAWSLALAPAKGLPMSAIGMYMTGNSLQIFSIMMVFMTFKTPLLALVGIQAAFQRYDTEGTRQKLLGVKAVYVLTNLMAVALGVWKVGKMGLLPTTRSDWLAWEAERVPLERAYPAVGFNSWRNRL